MLGAGSVLLLRGDGEPAVDCAVSSRLEDVDLPELVPRADLVPAGTVGRERRSVVAAFEELGAGFGVVEAGRFFKPGRPAPALVALADPTDDRLGLVLRDRLRVVDLPSGEVAWSVQLSAPIASGGLVGDDVTLLTSGASPVVLTLDGDTGEPLACADVPVAGSKDLPVSTLLTDQAGRDVVVVAGRPSSALTAARLPALPDAASADPVWQRELDGATEAGGVRVVEERVVLSRVTDPVRLAELALAGGIQTPLVTTYDAQTGAPTWTYPAGRPDRRAATVVGEDAGTGRTFLLEVSPGAGDQVTRTTWDLLALDPDGGLLWRRALGAGLVSGSRWGDRLVVQGPAPGRGALLRAFDLDGRPVWHLATDDLPAGRLRDNFGPPTMVGDRAVVPTPGGLAVVDLATGGARPIALEEPVDDLLLVGTRLVVRSGPALLVLAVPAVAGR